MSERQAIASRLQRLFAGTSAIAPLNRILPHLQMALDAAASPERASVNIERFVERVTDPAAVFQVLAERPHALDLLVTLFAGSQFLSEILIRRPDYFGLILRPGIAEIKSPARFHAEAVEALVQFASKDGMVPSPAPSLDALRRLQHWELLRIGLCDLGGLLDLATVTAQLSGLADGIVQVLLAHELGQMGRSDDGFAVLAMGKLGGGELNYSSDIDLLFLTDRDAAVFRQAGERLISALTEATGEGFLYRVDMRLRPWGRVGPLVPTVDGYLSYLARHARLWEKQALIKARVIAGDLEVGAEFLRRAGPLLFTANRETVRADVHAMKQRTEAHLRQLGRDWGEVKLGEGSIRDVEFVAQYLQLAHGARRPELRGGNTLEALARLADEKLLSVDEYRVLVDGYVFLRTVEHYLQILHYRQTHTLPRERADLRYLAQRLGFQGEDAETSFVTRYSQHSAAVRAVYQSHLAPLAGENGGDPMTSPAESSGARTYHGSAARQAAAAESQPESAVRQHIARLSPSYAETFAADEIQRHADLAARLDSDNPVEVDAASLGGGYWRVTVVGYDYLGELSIICGLLFAHGFTILDGHVYTYEPSTPASELPISSASDTRRKIVDVFTVHAIPEAERPEITLATADPWLLYAHELTGLLRLLQARQQREAQGELAKRVAGALHGVPEGTATLHPINIEIDNEASNLYTILRIDTPDTVGFLYEFTNALALNGIYIAQVTVKSVGNRVQDTLCVTDVRGRKIVSPEKQRELRAATVLVKHFSHLLPQSPNPESALLHFHEYLSELFGRQSWPDDLASLERPEVLNALARLLGVSDFLWDDFLRMQYANLFPVVRDVDALATPKTRAQLSAELAPSLKGASDAAARRDELNAFKDREMFRIDMRHILGQIGDFGQFSAELTDLVEVILTAAQRFCVAELSATYGLPLDENGRECPLCICALGKCGGRELGFASDIELMFVFAGSGQTTGPRIITTTEYFEKLVVETVRAIRARREGIFEIDLQLRPYGTAGSMAVSLDSFRRYFAQVGPAWSYERQALIKLRPIGGDRELGQQIRGLRDEFVYAGAPFDVAAMRAMRERQVRHLVTAGTVNAKFSPGGLVDAEYVIQGLQIRHGHADPTLRVTNTLEALAALAQAGIVSAENYARLREAYVFLRRLINALRMVRGNSKDLTVPAPDSEDFAFLARRLGYASELGRLQADLMDHVTSVQRLTVRLLG